MCFGDSKEGGVTGVKSVRARVAGVKVREVLGQIGQGLVDQREDVGFNY
jgi:hypothetical protein